MEAKVCSISSFNNGLIDCWLCQPCTVSLCDEECERRVVPVRRQWRVAPWVPAPPGSGVRPGVAETAAACVRVVVRFQWPVLKRQPDHRTRAARQLRPLDAGECVLRLIVESQQFDPA